MKPIFEQERYFFEEKSGYKLPKYCWRDGSKIYLNLDLEIPIIKFEVDFTSDKIIIKTNNIKEQNDSKVHIEGKFKNKKYDEWINIKTFWDEIRENNDRLNELIKETINMTVKYLNNNQDAETRISISGGKDSSVMNYLFLKYILPKLNNKNYVYDAFNTTNDTADTYRQMYKEGLDKENINNPLISIKTEDGNKKEVHMGWYQWIEDVKGYWIPNALKRSCCSTFKEGQIKKILDKNKKYTILLGVRKYESSKRSFYEFDIQKAYNKSGKEYNLPNNWKRIAPIVNWKDEDIWLLIIRDSLEVNPMYYIGFNRCGCLICPYNSDYTNMLIREYYPKQWNRWMDIIEKNYKIKNVENRLKWTLEEYLNGKWKVGLSKIHEYTIKAPTSERIKEVSNILGISEEMALKYFKKECSCGKKLNPDEIGMFLKMYGRYEGLIDERQYLCKECMCKEFGWTNKQYSEKVREFRKSGCNLF